MSSFNPDTLLRRQIFVSCGLTDKEALLYDVLLSKGQAHGYELEKESGLRKNTYALLNSLLQKKLVLGVKKDNKTYFQPAPPETLVLILKNQGQAVKQSQQALEQLLPALSSQYSLSVGKPTIRYFEGEEGIKEVFNDIYGPKEDVVYGCVDLETADKVFPSRILKKLIPQRVKNKLFAYSLVANSKQAHMIKKSDSKQLRKTMLLDKKLYPMPAEIDVYQDKVAMLSFERGKFVGIIIQNDSFAQSLRSLFKRVFDEVKPKDLVGDQQSSLK